MPAHSLPKTQTIESLTGLLSGRALEALRLDGLAALSPDQAAMELADDPVAKRLVRGLGQADLDDEDGAYEAALRLALTARLATVRASEKQEASDGLQKWRLKRVKAYIEDNIDETLSLADLARVAGLSRMYFASQFRAATGSKPHDYVLGRRIERAKEMLLGSEALASIAFDVGFQTQAHFTTVFRKLVGLTPGRWRLLYRARAAMAAAS